MANTQFNQVSKEDTWIRICKLRRNLFSRSVTDPQQIDLLMIELEELELALMRSEGEICREQMHFA